MWRVCHVLLFFVFADLTHIDGHNFRIASDSDAKIINANVPITYTGVDLELLPQSISNSSVDVEPFVVAATATLQILRSADFPPNDLGNASMVWNFTAENADDLVTLSIERAHLEYGDKILVHDPSLEDTFASKMREFRGPAFFEYSTDFVISSGPSILVTFVIDGYRPEKEFYAEFKTITRGVTPEYTFTANSQHQILKSPTFPNNHLDIHQFAWIIEAQNMSEHVLLQIVALDTAQDDKLEIFAGNDSVAVYEGPKLQKSSSDYIVIENHIAHITWTGDTSCEFCITKGFTIYYSTIELGEIPIFMRSAGITQELLTSPEISVQAPDQISEIWKIHTDQDDHNILLELTDIKLPIGSELRFYEKPDNGSSDLKIRTMSGPFTRLDSTDFIISSSPHLYVETYNPRSEFSIEFKFKYKAVLSLENHVFHLKSVAEQEQFLTSPYLRYHFPKDEEIVWTIQANSSDNRIVLVLENINLEFKHRLLITETIISFVNSTIDVSDNVLRKYIGPVIIQESTDFIVSTGMQLNVQYKPKLISQHDKGFTLKYFSILENESPKFYLKASGVVKSLTSPYYPVEVYPSFVSAKWVIGSDSNTRVIVLKIIDFHIAENDEVSVYNGENFESNLKLKSYTGKFMGSDVDKVLHTSSGCISVSFVSNSMETGKGFHFEYYTVAASSLVEFTATLRPQTILLPYILPVENSTMFTCWKIQTTMPNHVIMILIPFMKLNSDDTLGFYDGSYSSNTSVPAKREYNGSIFGSISMPGSYDFVISTTDQMFIIADFNGMSSNKRELYFYAIENGTTTSFELIADTTEKTMLSPNYPNSCPPDIKANWKITSANEDNTIILQIVELNILDDDEITIYDGNVTYDVIVVFNEENSKSSQGHFLRSSGNHLLISLKTDSQESGNGFKFIYHAVKVAATIIIPLEAEHQTKTISFPNIKEERTVYTKTAWRISSPKFGYVIAIKFNKINLGPGDSVAVYDGEDHSAAKLVQVYDADDTGKYIKSTRQHLYVQIVGTGLGDADKGIQLEYILDSATNGSAELDVCFPNPCPATHICRPHLGTYNCFCPRNYIGAQCTIRCDKHKGDIAFLLDSSKSVTLRNWQKLLDFVTNIVEELEVEDDTHRIGVITFSEMAEIKINLKDYINDTNGLISKISSLSYEDGTTNIAAAIRLMKDSLFGNEVNGDRPDVPNIGILITDGASTVDSDLTRAESSRAKFYSNITTFAIGIGRSIQESELSAIVSQPYYKYLFRVDDFDALGSLTRAILLVTCVEDLSAIQGHDGIVGAPGPAGLPGDTGPPGLKGEDGPPGPIGQMGENGTSTQNGSRGMAGPAGVQGIQGSPGLAGPDGDPGYTGAPGMPGDIGLPGGNDSIDGMSGVEGVIGAPGERGPTGFTGATGPLGETGLPGKTGPPGTQGSIGDAGLQGVRGPQGEKGPQGVHGPAGRPGRIDAHSNDIDQCGMEQGLCHHICVNIPNGHRCQCKDGYELAVDEKSCLDVNECDTWNGGCEQYCHNTIGSRVCTCGKGYTLSLDQKSCLDVDECCSGTIIPVCKSSELCVNTFGGYSCISKKIAYYPIKSSSPKGYEQKKQKLEESTEKSMLMTQNVFIALIIWMGVVTLVTIVGLCFIMLDDENSEFKRIRDSHLNEERYRRMTSQEAHQEYVFPRLNLGEEGSLSGHGASNFDYPDYAIAYRGRPVAKPPVERRKQYIQDRSGHGKSSDVENLEPQKRKHVVTIQSPTRDD